MVKIDKIGTTLQVKNWGGLAVVVNMCVDLSQNAHQPSQILCQAELSGSLGYVVISIPSVK